MKIKFSNAISSYRTDLKSNIWIMMYSISVLTVGTFTFLGNTDINNWFLENVLTFLSLIFLIFTFKKYQFSDLSYLLICVFLCLHLYGSQYTYAENPFGYWLQDIFNTSRNHYDRIVHFSFGFLLAYPMREFFLRWMKFPKMLAWWLPIEIVLSLSGLYELVEWAVADILFPEQGAAYLGTQGDIWDAQKDMFLAFSGSIIATTIVSSIKHTFKIYENESI